MRAGNPVYGGYTLTREEGQGIIFVRGALPEELVEIVIEEKKKDYSIARVVEIIEPSPWRVKPLCEVYGLCGGCQLQHAEYSYQLTLKAEVLKDILKRIAGLSIEIIPVFSLNPFHYRYRAQFKIGPSGIGFYKEASRELVNINYCPLMKEGINSLIPPLSGLGNFRSLREIHIASNDKENLLYLKGINYSPEMIDYLNSWRSNSYGTVVGVSFENKIHGIQYIYLPYGDLQYTVSARTFFQANWELNMELIRKIKELITDSSLRILDLYSGAGNFSIPLSLYVKDVTAVEEDPHAFNDLMRNIDLNDITNLRAVHSSIEKFRPSGRYDIVIIDPPRPGLTDRALKRVLEADPEEIFYISCNPSTLARDLKKLSSFYEIHSIEIFDFFPNTYHIETLTILKKRS